MTSTKARQVLLLVGTMLTVGLAAGPAGAATIRVPGDAPTIQAGINLAQSGDDVLVAPGVYYEHEIVLKGGVWIHTEQGPEMTVIDAQHLGRGFSGVDQLEMVTVEGFTVCNGQTTSRGGGIRVLRGPGIVRNCVIRNCEAEIGGGIYTEEAPIEISGCRVSNCLAGSEGGGVFAWAIESVQIVIADCVVFGNRSYYGTAGIAAVSRAGGLRIVGCNVHENISLDGFSAAGIDCSSPWLEIRSCIVTHNHHQYYGIAGIGVWGSSGEVVNCTVSHNSGLYFAYAVELRESSVAFDQSIISFNACRGLLGSSGSSLRCTDIAGNEGGNDFYGQDLGGNFSADPLFCDAANGDYTLDWASPCLPGNHPNGVDCGLIGALGAGCGTPPVTGACCFADDSCVVTEREDCASQGGTYLGDDTDCDPNPCVPTTTEKTTWGRIRAGYR